MDTSAALPVFMLTILFFCKQFQAESINEKYPCICPGLSRPVCTYSTSGNLNIYNSYCIAACINSNGFGILPRSVCSQSHSTQNPVNTSSEEYITNWVGEMKKEAAVSKQINNLLYELLELSSVPGASSPCTCPGIHRPAYMYGTAGAIINFNNVCSLKCFAIQNNYAAAIFPSNMKMNIGKYNGRNGLAPKNETLEQREERELKVWMSGIKEDIEFYRRIYGAMDGIFNYDKNDITLVTETNNSTTGRENKK